MTGRAEETVLSLTAAGPHVDVLFVDAEDLIAAYAPILEHTYRVVATSSVVVGREFLRRSLPTLVITDLHLEDGLGVCRDARAMDASPSVLVLANDATQVPDALDAGCNGVLLKPFPPNTLVSRVGLLLRERATHAQTNTSGNRAAQTGEFVTVPNGGSNRTWPDLRCPYCDERGVTSFDYTSRRRAWYACLACRKVWLDKRRV